MLARKLGILPLVFLAVLFLNACSKETARASLSDAIDQGIIAPPGDSHGEQSPQFLLVPVTRGDIVREVDLQVAPHFAVTRNLSFERHGGVFMGSLVTYNAAAALVIIWGGSLFIDYIEKNGG